MDVRVVDVKGDVLYQEFQCRERLEWDFYRLVERYTFYKKMRREFQCRERLEWDFYVEGGTTRGRRRRSWFQCRERLEWDFYSTPGPSA